MDFDPKIGPGAGFSDWMTKHPEHLIDFLWPGRTAKMDPVLPGDWEGLLPNADVKISYAASRAPTLTLASLAASSTLLGGRESSAVDNGATNKYLDVLVAGFFKTAAANAQIGSINVAVVGNLDDTPTWPDVFDGTDSVETVSLQGVYDQVCKLAAQITTTATNALVWPFGPVAIAGLFGGVIPDQFVFFISHNAETTTAAWDATEGSHSVKMTEIYATVL